MKLCTLTAAQHRDLGFSFPCIIRLELEWPRSQDANSIREYASIRGFWYETVYSISNTNIWMSAMLLILFYSSDFPWGADIYHLEDHKTGNAQVIAAPHQCHESTIHFWTLEGKGPWLLPFQTSKTISCRWYFIECTVRGWPGTLNHMHRSNWPG